MLKIVTLISIILLSSCASNPVYLSTKIPVPPEPILPTATPDEFAVSEDGGRISMSVETYKKLSVRDTILREDSTVLRKLMRSHNENIND